MTIKLLKKLIKDLPDDMRIYADDARYFGDDISEFITIYTSSRYPGKAILQTTNDFDTEEETGAMLKYFSENDIEEQDAWIELSEMGYQPKDFKDPDWARAQMENYGLI